MGQRNEDMDEVAALKAECQELREIIKVQAKARLQTANGLLHLSPLSKHCLRRSFMV